MMWFLALHLVELILGCGINIRMLIPPSEVQETTSFKSTLYITTRTPDYLYIHELTVTAQQLASVAQLVRALHRNRRAVGSIPTRGPCAAFFAAVPGQILKCI